jgi:hypothetical protein
MADQGCCISVIIFHISLQAAAFPERAGESSFATCFAKQPIGYVGSPANSPGLDALTSNPDPAKHPQCAAFDKLDQSFEQQMAGRFWLPDRQVMP